MSITELLSKYTEEDFETVLTMYLIDPEALEKEILKVNPKFAALIQQLDSHMHDESYDPKLEEGYHDGMMTMLQLLVYLEKHPQEA